MAVSERFGRVPFRRIPAGPWRGIPLLPGLFLALWGLAWARVAPAQAGPAPFPRAPLLRAAPFLGEARHVLGLDGSSWNPLGRAPKDPYLSPWVEGILENPLVFPGLASRWAARLAREDPREALALSLEFRGLKAVPASRPELEGAHTVSDLLQAAFAGKVPLERAGGLSPGLRELLLPLLRSALAARLWCAEAAKGLGPRERDLLLEELAERWTGRRAPDRAETGRILGLAGSFDSRLTALAARVLALGFSRFLSVEGKVSVKGSALPGRISAPGYEGDLRLFLPTPWGDLVVGGPGVTIYRKRAFLVLDLGGDDLYLCPAGSAVPEMPVSVVVDLGGDDLYRSPGRGGQGAGLLGIGFLADLGAGRDLYDGGDLSQGVGILGTGILLDDGGRNLFRAGRASQGAGLLGTGILLAGAGEDSYRGNAPCQGTAGPGGAGLLVDSGGGDVYTSSGRGSPAAPLPSQGGAAGWAEVWASGGTGLLLDLGGDDTYSAERSAQGAAFLRGGAALLDSRGNDRFHSGRWSQGMGSSRGAGLLMDGAGDDSYGGGDVSQGAGHDMGVGMLLDVGGDDRFRAGGLCQGAGSWHGSGFLFDLSGNDVRQARPGKNGGAQGWGGKAGGWGSLGVLIDCGGKDYNSLGPGDGGRKTRGLAGISIDSGSTETTAGRPAPSPSPPVPGRKEKGPDLLSLEKDLHRALDSLPGSPPWKASVKDLARGGKKALEWLAARAFASPTPAMSSFFEAAALEVGGEEAARAARAGLEHSFPGSRALAARVLGLLGDRASLDKLKDLLASDPSRAVRRAAAEALGRIGLAGVPSGLEALRSSSSVLDRVAAAACLEGVAGKESVSSLLDLLEDRAWPVRERAEAALEAKGAQAVPEVVKKLKEGGKGAVRIPMVRILGKARAVEARSLLLGFLEDPDPVLRAAAVRALRSIGEKGDLERLKALLPLEMNPLVREALKGL